MMTAIVFAAMVVALGVLTVLLPEPASLLDEQAKQAYAEQNGDASESEDA